MASLDPIWIKIADFGASKRVKGTSARTRVGTQRYMAPEVHGVVSHDVRKGFIPHALDIWSLGSLVHELLTSEAPFIEPIYGSNVDSESGVQADSEREIDFTSLREYCHGHIEFPTTIFQKPQLSEEEIAFVKSLLIANPEDRPTTTRALENSWLTGYISDCVKELKGEFTCLGVDLDFGDKDIWMRQASKEDIMRFLPSSATEQVSSLLMEAAAKGCNSVISRLLGSRDCSLESIDSLTRGKLFQLAAESMQPDTIKLLLKNKANIGACIGDQTVLKWMVGAGNVNTVNILLENTADVKTNKCCFGALLLCIKSGHVDMVKVFLSKDIDINASNSNRQTALQAAAGGGHIDIVKLLLDNNADVNAKAPEYGLTALQAAVKGGHATIFNLLLDNNADVNAKAPEYGLTALQAAVKGGHATIVKILLDNKADVNAEAPEYGLTVLQAAVKGGHTAIFKMLLDNKADVNAEAPEDGLTVLQTAVKGGHSGIVKLLSDSKADANPEATRNIVG